MLCYFPAVHELYATIFFCCAYLVCIVWDGNAGQLKVDINRDGKNSLSTTATGYIQWTSASGVGTSSTGTAPITESFPFTNTDSTISTVTISLAMTATAQSAGGTGLTYTYYAPPGTTILDGQKLVSDGITVNPAER